MGRMAGGLLGTVIVGITVFTINLFFMSLAGVLRMLPLLLPIAGRLSMGILVFSCRLYYLLLSRVAAVIEARTRIKILEGLWRLGVTLSTSVILGLLLLFLAQVPVVWWSVLPFVIHGLFVDFVWEEIPGLGGLDMGTRL